MADELDERVHWILQRLYALAAALVRHDLDGAALLVGELESAGYVHETMTAGAMATLERLDATLGGVDLRSEPTSAPWPDSGGRQLAFDLFDRACGFGFATAESVSLAARLLEPIRRSRHAEAVTEVTAARSRLGDRAVLSGSAALLAAVVAVNARQRGVSAGQAARELCLATALDMTLDSTG